MSNGGTAQNDPIKGSKCSVNHGRIVKSDDTSITFQDGVVMRKGTMEIIHDPRENKS